MDYPRELADVTDDGSALVDASLFGEHEFRCGSAPFVPGDVKRVAEVGVVRGADLIVVGEHPEVEEVGVFGAQFILVFVEVLHELCHVECWIEVSEDRLGGGRVECAGVVRGVDVDISCFEAAAHDGVCDSGDELRGEFDLFVCFDGLGEPFAVYGFY